MTQHATKLEDGGVLVFWCDACRRSHVRVSCGGTIIQMEIVDSASLRAIANQALAMADRQDAEERESPGHA